VRELLRVLADRLNECPRGYLMATDRSGTGFDPQDPERLIPKLQKLVGEVLASGIFDGRMTELDMRQLPPVL
jgi:hypothetical protein